MELFALTEGVFCQRAALFPRLRGEVSPFPELSIVSSRTTALKMSLVDGKALRVAERSCKLRRMETGLLLLT